MDSKLLDISVLAEQSKNLIPLAGETGNAGIDALLYTLSEQLHKIQTLADELEGGVA